MTTITGLGPGGFGEALAHLAPCDGLLVHESGRAGVDDGRDWVGLTVASGGDKMNFVAWLRRVGFAGRFCR